MTWLRQPWGHGFGGGNFSFEMWITTNLWPLVLEALPGQVAGTALVALAKAATNCLEKGLVQYGGSFYQNTTNLLFWMEKAICEKKCWSCCFVKFPFCVPCLDFCFRLLEYRLGLPCKALLSILQLLLAKGRTAFEGRESGQAGYVLCGSLEVLQDPKTTDIHRLHESLKRFVRSLTS